MIGLEEVPYGEHLCALYADDQERLELAQFFLRPALEKGGTCCIISDRRTSAAILSDMRRHWPGMSQDAEKRIFSMPFSRLIRKVRSCGVEDAISEWYKNMSDIAKISSGGMHILSIPGKLSLSDEIWRAYEGVLDKIVDNNSATVCCMYRASCSDVGRLWSNISMHKSIFAAGWVCRNPAYLPGQSTRLSENARCVRMIDNTHLVALENEVTRCTLGTVMSTKNQMRKDLDDTRIKLEKALSVGYHFGEPLRNIRNSTNALRSSVEITVPVDMHLHAIDAALHKIEECLRDMVESGKRRWTGYDNASLITIPQDDSIRRAA